MRPNIKVIRNIVAVVALIILLILLTHRTPKTAPSQSSELPAKVSDATINALMQGIKRDSVLPIGQPVKMFALAFDEPHPAVFEWMDTHGLIRIQGVELVARNILSDGIFSPEIGALSTGFEKNGVYPDQRNTINTQDKAQWGFSKRVSSFETFVCLASETFPAKDKLDLHLKCGVLADQ